MPITNQHIKKLAQLARLAITPEEEARFAVTISDVLDYMTILNEVDTSGIEPTAQVTGLHNVIRADVVKASAPGQELLSQLPEREGDELLVPGVFAGSVEE